MSSVELLAFDPASDSGLLAGWLRKPHISRQDSSLSLGSEAHRYDRGAVDWSLAY